MIPTVPVALNSVSHSFQVRVSKDILVSGVFGKPTSSTKAFTLWGSQVTFIWKIFHTIVANGKEMFFSTLCS